MVGYGREDWGSHAHAAMRSHPDSPQTPLVDPVIVTTKSALRTIVGDAVDGALQSIRSELNASPTTSEKRWLTNREAQSYLGLSKATLARYRANGTLPYSKVGSSVYYRLDDVEALLSARLVTESQSGSEG